MHVLDEDGPWCALAFSVASGSFCDPDDCPGLAHLLEHVLFTGSENYPKDNYLLHFLDEHQGKINAWTSAESTTFYFKVHHKYFAKALHIFFDMLKAPLFSLDGIEKEITTIDAEFHNKINEEQRRVMEVQKETCNPDHPFHHFAVGNREIFGVFSTEEIARRLKAYWQEHFVAEQISLCVLTNSVQAEAIAHITEQLDSFPRGKQYLPAAELRHLYSEKQLNKYIRIHTERAHKRLMLIFHQTPDLANAADVETIVSHLFGYEGEGSLMRYWKAQKWASQVIAGPGLKGSGFSDFNLYIELSDHGLAHVNDIINSVFFYAQLIKESQHILRHYEEKVQLNKLAFEHKGALNPLDLVQQLVKNLNRYPSEDILTGDYLLGDFQQDKLNQFLDNLCQQRLRVISISNSHKCEHLSKWYKVPYEHENLSLQAPSPEQLKEFQSCIQLPHKNPYIPEIKASDLIYDELPQRAVTAFNNFWFGSENRESQHKGECFFSWHKTTVVNDIEQVAHRKLYASTLEANFHQNFYQAQLAGLHFHFYAHQNGIGLHTSGFADKQLALVTQLLQKVYATPQPCPDFELHKAEYLNSLHSSSQNKPLNRLFTALQAIFVPASWLPEDLATVVKGTELSDIQARHDAFFKSCYLESLIYGDWAPAELKGFVKQLDAMAQSQATRQTERQLVYLNDINERSFCFPCKHPDSALVLYLQTTDKSLLSRAQMMLVESILAGYYFDRMRNQKQLGYQVGTGYMPFNEHPGTVLFIQSPNASAWQLYVETLNSLQAFYQWLCQIDLQQWHKYRKNLERQIKQKSINFSVKCQRYWGAIGREKVDFSHEKQLNSTIAKLEKNAVCDWFKANFLEPEQSFALYSEGAENTAVNNAFINPLENIYQFK
ncbi:insulinase family protein [Planctobacterium marinum]|uniref:Protease 3 n=1 Tax=Planctobacterium marinum TaxID=1631968 RepID=A0AA48HFX1_9ALTE|nr:protease III [Planctobacterium marinum]